MHNPEKALYKECISYLPSVMLATYWSNKSPALSHRYLLEAYGYAHSSMIVLNARTPRYV